MANIRLSQRRGSLRARSFCEAPTSHRHAPESPPTSRAGFAHCACGLARGRLAVGRVPIDEDCTYGNSTDH